MAKSLSKALEKQGLDKWGLVIYRCSYTDDVAWAAVKRTIQSTVAAYVSSIDRRLGMILPADNLAATMDWTFVEDRKGLDGISTQELRERFLSQRCGELAREQPRASDPISILQSAARYNYFVKVDEEALQHATEAGDDDDEFARRFTLFVNVVDANWSPQREEEEGCSMMGSDGEPIEGLTYDNVGWYRAVVDKLHPDFYHDLSTASVTDVWATEYVRPPEIVYS